MGTGREDLDADDAGAPRACAACTGKGGWWRCSCGGAIEEVKTPFPVTST